MIRYIVKKPIFIQDNQYLTDAVVEIIQNIDESTWIQVYNEWIERIKKVIDCNGEYPDF